MQTRPSLATSAGRLLAVLTLAATITAASHADVTLRVTPATSASVSGGDDVARLKHLASGVGWEFEPNDEARAGLKRLGIKTLRCINVDPLGGRFEDGGRFTIEDASRLNWHLDACRELGARPHVIIATGLHPDLQLKKEDVRDQGESIMGMVHKAAFGPTNWPKFEAYCEAYFEYVLVAQGFADAEFEVANEPDIGGAVHPTPPRPANGSRALYEGYLELYRHVAIAAGRFQDTHPGLTVKLGGPALAWAYTFRYGDLNWAEQFIRDCGEQRIKLDFIGVHYYGNISSLDGEYEANYPPFTGMLQTTLAARDRYCPATPIQITEWGPSYRTDNSPEAAVNANHIGAAWSAAFLNLMLRSGVDDALYLVTTDLRQQDPEGKWVTVWGWPSLFTNPSACGHAFPKAPSHVFDMIARLAGQRVGCTGAQGAVNAFACASAGQVQVLVWNYGARIPEGGVAEELAKDEEVRLQVAGAAAILGDGPVRLQRWLVSQTTSNAHHLFITAQTLDDRASLQQVQDAELPAAADLELSFPLPPSGVSLVTLSRRP